MININERLELAAVRLQAVTKAARVHVAARDNCLESDTVRDAETKLIALLALEDRLATDALDAIHTMLDAREWDGDTLDRIASIMRDAGYAIREPRT